MLMRSLEAHDVPEAVLDAWESHCGRELLPVQELAVKAGVLAGRSLLVSSPTSSGKTFVGEMAAIQAALSGRRVVYLVPTRALAEAKYRQFCARYEPVGLSVAIATRDRRHQHDRVARGDFDLVVAVPEKLRALLAARPGLAEVIGTVVADELQVLADPERGPCLELLLGDLVAAAPELQVVGLSAVLGEAQQVAQWLGAELLRDDRRPVELRRGVLEGGSYHYRQHNDGAEGTEKWPELAEGPADPGERMAQVAAALAERDGSALIFVRDRRTTELMARAIAQMGQLPAAEGTVAALEALEQTRCTQLLRELAAAGVAFHSADLRFDEREAVEAGFARGELSSLVCTSTLAMGVNLPARNVIIDTNRWCSGGPDGKPSLGAITRADFENMAGRAGRLGCGEQPGRAILIADGEIQRHVFTTTYLNGDFARLTPQLGAQPPLHRVCLLAGSAAGSPTGAPAGIAEAWQRSLSARAAALPPGMLPSELREALDLAAAHDLTTEPAPGEWQATPLGTLCGTSGLTPRSFLALVKAARAAESVAPDELEALLIAALTDEAQAIPLPPPVWGSGPGDDFLEPSAPCDDQWELERLLATARSAAAGSAPAYRRERAVRIALAMRQWRSLRPTADVEAMARVPAGRLAVLAEAVGWSLQVLARIGREIGWPAEQWRAMLRLGESTAAGVPEEGLALHNLHVPGLGRGQILALLDAGLDCQAAVAHASPALLESLLGLAMAARTLAVACGVRTGPAEPTRRVAPAIPPRDADGEEASTRQSRLIIDAERPDRILLDAEPVELRPAEFRLLSVLAESPRRCVGYEAIYEGMWSGEAFVEPAQIYSHRSRLAKKLDDAVPGGADLLRTIPRRGLMLDLPPEGVTLR